MEIAVPFPELDGLEKIALVPIEGCAWREMGKVGFIELVESPPERNPDSLDSPRFPSGGCACETSRDIKAANGDGTMKLRIVPQDYSIVSLA
jgi:hypothetical protein